MSLASQDRHPKSIRRWVFLFLVSAPSLLVPINSAWPKGFVGGISPSRFELVAKPGEVIKRSLKIYNLGTEPQDFDVKTSEWTFSESGAIAFQSELAANSCRPWAKLERHQLKILPSATRARNYRFEIHVPDNAPAQECRFAIMMSSEENPYETTLGGGQISLPASVKIAVIVYVAVGDAAPQTTVERYTVKTVQDQATPVVVVHNKGNAHDRLDSELTGIDGNGEKLSLSIDTSPILPGQRRQLVLTPHSGYRNKHKTISYPLTIRGRLFSEKGAIEVDTVLRK